MDSKLKRAAILSCFAFVFAISLLVLYMNGGTSQGGASQAVNATAESSVDTEPTTNPAVQNGQIGNDLSAFLKDNTFFDEEIDPILEAAKNQKNKLSLVTTSVEKDLRIQIVDNEGVPVTGKSFYVDLEGVGEYKDLDQDGVIYIGDLDSGEYNVSLLPMEGYRVPTSDTRVRVKEKVEYLAIDDISLLIKTEDEVDAQAEDTRIQDALADADKTEIKKFQQTTGNAKLGIDVSKWNGEIDWDKVKNAGVEYAIIRVGYRGSVTGSIIEDPYFEANIKGAIKSGIKVGVYFFTQAVNEVEAVEEASAVINRIKGYQLDYPIFIDTEGAGGNGRADGLGAEDRTLVCEAFCRTIANAGYQAGVYASRNWYNNNLDTERLDDYYIWLAEYRSVPLYQGYYQMWQYTSKGKVDGIEGKVDMNIAYE
ncbi:MAG: glycoside hydrolase family 25 protein [Lachnospiraceae bacterium]|nr:glycoside hydrolase family 25 protein [Lachnospiraceae bacterium]